MPVGAVAPGMVVAAIYAEDNTYCRAKIVSVELPKVDVLYIDWGNTSTVSYCNLCKLSDTFLNIPCQVIIGYANKLYSVF
jgi:hypothetical protein